MATQYLCDLTGRRRRKDLKNMKNADWWKIVGSLISYSIGSTITRWNPLEPKLLSPKKSLSMESFPDFWELFNLSEGVDM